ncbi:MAG TPA: polysaccharide deacetylase family protein [Bacteroidales bacterium]|nr:polysaccharide deacetylase family protein [Bacteroidales bacterium]
MNLVKIPGVLKKLFPAITWEIRTKDPVLYLTFDDGPTPVITDQVLGVLEKYNAKATFFCIGRNVERHPGIYENILKAGHYTGNHTYSHLKGWYTPDKEYYSDIQLAAQFINSGLYRPAYGMITTAQLKHLRATYQIVLWDVMSYDFAYNTSPEQCLKNVIRYAGPGSIIVFHDSLKASEKVLYALPRVLEYFREKGYTFRTI